MDFINDLLKTVIEKSIDGKEKLSQLKKEDIIALKDKVVKDLNNCSSQLQKEIENMLNVLAEKAENNTKRFANFSRKNCIEYIQANNLNYDGNIEEDSGDDLRKWLEKNANLEHRNMSDAKENKDSYLSPETKEFLRNFFKNEVKTAKSSNEESNDNHIDIEFIQK